MKKMIAGLLSTLVVALAAVPAWAGKITITGSTTVQPIAEKIAAAYMTDNPGVSIEVTGGGSGNGIKAIIDGTADIGNASRFIKDSEVAMASGQKIYPVPHKIAYDCIVPIVHPGNPVGNLSLDHLREIYKGTITNWKNVGGDDRPIKVVSRDMSSGTYEVWESKVMNKENVFPGAQLEASNDDVLRAVSLDSTAIGYIGLGYLQNSVKAIKVDNIKGSEKTTISGAYPISRPLFMFTRGWPTGDTMDFINYIQEPGKGQMDVKKSGFVSLYHGGSATEVVQATAESQSKIMMVQKYLNGLRYNAGPVDGLKGAQTVSAMMQFQKDNKLPVDSNITDDFLVSLSNSIAKTGQKL